MNYEKMLEETIESHYRLIRKEIQEVDNSEDAEKAYKLIYLKGMLNAAVGIHIKAVTVEFLETYLAKEIAKLKTSPEYQTVVKKPVLGEFLEEQDQLFKTLDELAQEPSPDEDLIVIPLSDPKAIQDFFDFLKGVTGKSGDLDSFKEKVTKEAEKEVETPKLEVPDVKITKE